MGPRTRVFLLAMIMLGVAVGVTGITLAALYAAAFDQQKARLLETAHSQARLLEAIARHEASFTHLTEGTEDHGDSLTATLETIRQSHAQFKGFGRTGEFTLAKREGDQIVFLLSHRHADLDDPQPVPFSSDLAEPMRLALTGNSGTLVGLDYRGKQVLAAHEPVKDLDLGIVAKIDLSEVREPFVHAGLLAASGAAGLIFLGILAFFRVGNPIVRRLEEGERKYRRIFDSAADSIVVVDPQTGRFVDFNAIAHQHLGYTREEFRELAIADVDAIESAEETAKHAQKVARDGADTFETRMKTKQGDLRDVLVSSTTTSVDDKPCVLSIWHDITERKQARRFLEIANRHTQMKPLLEEFMVEVKRFTGCAAVGIRILDEDGRIPYQVHDGFSPRFCELESPLSIRDDRCMCIEVIKGKADASLPFYTEGGSFSVNATTRFLATISEEMKGETRNACNEFGYESVVLVPIRLGEGILGLIHVADNREDAIPLEVVESLERTGLQLGASVQRVRAEEALRTANEELETRVTQRTAELEKANRELTREITQRRRLETEVLEIGTREQRRIGQELHDGLGQELTGLSYLATSLHRKLRSGDFAEADTAAELATGIPRVLGQIQGIVKGLVPLEVGAEDLIPALQSLAANVEERTGVPCSFESNGPVKIRDDNTTVQLYRIAQEAVTNAVKHAHSSSIAVTIGAKQGHITLQVSDNGVGIPSGDKKGSGSGMHIMQYRARAIGGTLEIKPRTGGGTLVTSSLPLE